MTYMLLLNCALKLVEEVLLINETSVFERMDLRIRRLN